MPFTGRRQWPRKLETRSILAKVTGPRCSGQGRSGSTKYRYSGFRVTLAVTRAESDSHWDWQHRQWHLLSHGDSPSGCQAASHGGIIIGGTGSLTLTQAGLPRTAAQDAISDGRTQTSDHDWDGSMNNPTSESKRDPPSHDPSPLLHSSSLSPDAVEGHGPCWSTAHWPIGGLVCMRSR